jgi:hypothetical protein
LPVVAVEAVQQILEVKVAGALVGIVLQLAFQYLVTRHIQLLLEQEPQAQLQEAQMVQIVYLVP